jgi:hypothetical protein
MMPGLSVTGCCAGRCVHATPRGLIAKIFTTLVMLPHFIHIGATRLNAIGSGMVPRLAVVSVFAERNPDLGLERA